MILYSLACFFGAFTGLAAWFFGFMLMMENVSDLHELGLKGQRLGQFMAGWILTMLGLFAILFCSNLVLNLMMGNVIKIEHYWS